MSTTSCKSRLDLFTLQGSSSFIGHGPLVVLHLPTQLIHPFSYDSICNTYLIKECGLHPPTSSQYGLVVHSHGDFFGSIAFPAVAELGLRVNKLGKSSVTWEIGLFEQGVEEIKSVGSIIHVFVDRETGRPAASGMNVQLKDGLERLLVPQSKL